MTKRLHSVVQSRGRIRAGVWRKDGFASLDCEGQASLITKPVVIDGAELRVNFRPSPGGSLRVALIDEKGRPFEGFSLDECEALTVDSVSHAVSWKRAETDISSLAAKSVCLQFAISKGQLFSFRFAK